MTSNNMTYLLAFILGFCFMFGATNRQISASKGRVIMALFFNSLVMGAQFAMGFFIAKEKYLDFLFLSIGTMVGTALAAFNMKKNL